MPHATATIATHDGSRLIKRLCTHWAHKLDVSFDLTRARIAFDADTIATLFVRPDALEARISAGDGARLAQIQDVVDSHLQRMARGETLEISWQPDANPA